MKVLHIVSGIDPKSGGPTRSITGLCRALVQEGIEAHLFVASPTHDMQNTSGVIFHKGRGGSLILVKADVEKIILQIQPNIIHIHGLWEMVNHAAVILASERGIPIVQSPRGMLDPWALSQKKWKKRIAWWVYQKRDLKKIAVFHATAEMEKKNIQAKGFTTPVYIVPNAVEVPVLPVTRSSKASSLQTALFLSRLHPGKGLLELATAWAILKKESSCEPIKGWRMRIVGPDNYGHKAEVVARLKKLGVENDWQFAGEVDDIQKWAEYANADLFIHPSHSENFGVSIAEALYSGLPVIATKGAPWSELMGVSESGGRRSEETSLPANIITSSRTNDVSAIGRCGWWIDIGVEPLVQALRDAMNMGDEDRQIMGENGRQLIENMYTWPVVAKEMANGYRWLLHGGATPDNVRFS
jgi:glycosyltransferase involved in cell wall biosynthesis